MESYINIFVPIQCTFPLQSGFFQYPGVKMSHKTKLKEEKDFFFSIIMNETLSEKLEKNKKDHT